MEQEELQLVEQYSKEDPELKSLWEEHVLYEKQVAKLESKPFLTPDEEQSLKLLKKQKLDGKTRLHDLLNKYRRK